LDHDPEVYRLGFGTEAALDRLRSAAEQNLFDLRVQYGVRIGVVIADDLTMIFAPVPLLIEAGSTSVEKPNAIIFSRGEADRLAEAAGAGPADTAANRHRSNHKREMLVWISAQLKWQRCQIRGQKRQFPRERAGVGHMTSAAEASAP
jgi:hypothetical protein